MRLSLDSEKKITSATEICFQITHSTDTIEMDHTYGLDEKVVIVFGYKIRKQSKISFPIHCIVISIRVISERSCIRYPSNFGKNF